MNTLELKYPPVAVFVACALAMAILVFLFPDFGVSGGDPWTSALASLIGALGVVLGVVGVIQFRMRRTTVHPQHPERTAALVSDGVYAFTRNPMYLGLALLLAAGGVYAFHLAGVVATAAFVGWMNRFQIAPEERAMAAKFGADYEDYCRRVKRWI